MICSRKGYPLKVVMPENVTPERTQLLKMYGAEIVYSPGDQGSNGAVAMALEMAEADSSYYMPYQYGNQANPDAHYNGTAPEILEELDGEVDRVRRRPRHRRHADGQRPALQGGARRRVKIVAAEPMQGEPVQGLRSLDDGFIPPIIDISLLDRKIFVTNRDAIIWTRKLLDEEGVFAGVSSGAIARDRGAHRRRARRGQRRLHRLRRRLEVPLERDLHPSDRGDREPRVHRLVVGTRAVRRALAPMPKRLRHAQSALSSSSSWSSPCSSWARRSCPRSGARSARECASSRTRSGRATTHDDDEHAGHQRRGPAERA